MKYICIYDFKNNKSTVPKTNWMLKLEQLQKNHSNLNAKKRICIYIYIY